MHVDDFLFAGNKDPDKAIITKLRLIFLIGKEDKLNFEYLELNVASTNSTITLDQYQYIQNLHKIEIHADLKKEPTSPLNKAEKDQLRAKLGQVLLISNQARLDY